MPTSVSSGNRVFWNIYYSNSAEIRSLDMNYNGIVSCWGNPNIYDGGESGNRPMQTSVPYTIRYRKSQSGAYTPAQWGIPSDLVVRTSAQNSQANNIYNIGYRIASNMGRSNSYANASSVVVSAGNVIRTTHVNTIANILSELQSILGGYNGWFDANGVCALSCQVQCQVNCQVTCQSCYGGQCHNKNCGLS